jgi:hypothetical protein
MGGPPDRYVCEVLRFQQLLGETGEKHEDIDAEYIVSRPTFEANTF